MIPYHSLNNCTSTVWVRLYFGSSKVLTVWIQCTSLNTGKREGERDILVLMSLTQISDMVGCYGHHLNSDNFYYKTYIH